jgi:hypothetical protein
MEVADSSVTLVNIYQSKRRPYTTQKNNLKEATHINKQFQISSPMHIFVLSPTGFLVCVGNKNCRLDVILDTTLCSPLEVN